MLIRAFIESVIVHGKPRYPNEIFMRQRAKLALRWADKLEGIV